MVLVLSLPSVWLCCMIKPSEDAANAFFNCVAKDCGGESVRQDQ